LARYACELRGDGLASVLECPQEREQALEQRHQDWVIRQSGTDLVLEGAALAGAEQQAERLG
jgi:hypothetical protein